ncbi:RNA polymerase sigma factor [Telluribacter sp. SYSU D00476]|uniref:RNA polymerase sigma factor n=1 Tax=Telluribacter sp. SYSU D00476 TaxID=2811430 RepID=UPI001FF21876|nr:sigma-70 family RNA polymerase sigma factor [Telluribacter sp. SYSU D00476]
MSKRLAPQDAHELWQEYRSGDIYALAKIMQAYYPDLYHWGMRLRPDKDFVKDCIQETFLNLWKIHATINEVENVRSYLMVMLKTRILRELSGKYVTHQTNLSDEYAFSVEFSADLRLIEEENEVYQLRKLEQMINTLPARQKELIYLRFYQSLSFEQISEVMQLGRQSVYNLLQKSLNSLRKNWAIGSFLLPGLLCL